MHSADLIYTLAAAFIAALLLGYAMFRLGLSPIVGYLIAGILIGPHTPGFVADRGLAEQVSEIGVALLMFGVGLHFHLKDLLVVKRIAITGALLQSVLAAALVAWIFHAFGWSWSSGLVLGAALSISSTVVLTRVLSDAGDLQSPTGRVSIGWLVVEDILTVFVLVLLPVLLKSPEGSQENLLLAIGVAAFKLVAFIAVTLLVGTRVVPWCLDKVARTGSRELFTLGVLAVALGIAVGSAHFFHVSMALGAFLAGMVVGQSEFSARAGAEAMPLRDAFAVMFFVSVGLLFDPAQALASPWPILASLAVVILARPIIALVIVLGHGYGSRVALGVSLARAQIGEFSFLLAAVGKSLGAMPDEAMNALVATAIVSIMVNPALYRAVNPLEQLLTRQPALWRALNPRAARASDVPVAADQSSYRAVIVGYGPVGQLLSRILLQRGIQPTIVEMNLDTHGKLRSQGQPVVYGDATRAEILEQAGIASAASFILSASGSAGATEGIRAARERNPNILVVARADFLKDAQALRKAGADEVFSGEGEVALAMADSILRRLGATPEQLDAARDRIRETLL